MKPSLNKYLASLPIRGGRAEELRQKRIRAGAKAIMKPIHNELLNEMRLLSRKAKLTKKEQLRLSFFKRRYPDDDLTIPPQEENQPS